MTNGLILMTALVPTIGHDYLIRFASNFCDKLHVIISTRSFEPVSSWTRLTSLQYTHPGVEFYNHHDDDAPQNPPEGDQSAFWNYWADIIYNTIRPDIDLVFASEPYGQKVADSIGARFIPVDLAREVFPVKGTNVRSDLFRNQHLLNKAFKEKISSNFVLFGAESCGKTTMAKALSKHFHGQYLPEYARPYLETIGSELTEQKMLDIVKGQKAMEDATKLSNILTFKDTDPLSTLGYYNILGWDAPFELLQNCYNIPYNTLYLVMDTDNPFVEDELRYGGKIRQSDTAFWVNILERYGQDYKVISGKNKFDQCVKLVLGHEFLPNHTYRKIREFERD